ncbi:MAG: FAD-dependent thymidylate synthase [bacterium]|nr:FAD-dependent thymidylate synthase [bacterium]MCP5069739.1 FAD-dependent thymidylate synthase [bacterium]
MAELRGRAPEVVLDGGPEIRLRNWFDAPYDDAIAAARTCYSPRVIRPDEITPGQRQRIGPLTFEGGHHTVYTHANFEFELSGISRQLVWSLLHGFPFYNSEQQSQRYVKLEEARAHVPEVLDGEARRVYERAICGAWSAYAELTRLLVPRTSAILSDLWRLPDRASKAFGRNVAKEAEKKAIETARYVIPVACHTAMVYTISGITLHRLHRMAAACDAPTEARRVIGRMVEEVRKLDPDFIDAIGEGPIAEEEIVEFEGRQRGPADPTGLEAFDKSLDGRSARLVDWGARAPQVVAGAVRSVLGLPDLEEAEALARALDPTHNRYRLDRLNVSAHSPVMRALSHANYTFRKKLSHTADSQDQRHRMVPGSRPLLLFNVPDVPDVVEPALIAEDPECHALFRESIEASWDARRRLHALGVDPEFALYVLPNALALRFEESGSLLHLLHKWTMRTCLNAQREIFEASLDEIEQVRNVHPEFVRYVGPPCSLRSGRIRPRCTEGSHFCGVPVWRSFPDVERRI